MWDPSYIKGRHRCVRYISTAVQTTSSDSDWERAILKANTTKARRSPTTRENLDVLMEAIALIIARRQMRRQWATARRVTLA